MAGYHCRISRLYEAIGRAGRSGQVSRRSSRISGAACRARTADAVTNLYYFCLVAATLTWIYADRIVPDLQRRHFVKGRTSFAFSDVRRLIADAAMDPNYMRVWPGDNEVPKNDFAALPLRLVALGGWG